MSRKIVFICSGILSITVCVVFGNSLINGFVWDDVLYTSNNPVYKNFDVISMIMSLANGLEYLPVRDISYALDHALGGGTPLFFHISNLLIYAVTVLLVFGYAGSCYRHLHPAVAECNDNGPLIVGFVTALLFAVHPIHSEVVSFITCRNALLSTLFFLGATFLLLIAAGEECSDKRRWVFYGSALCLFMLSVFSKATGIVLPLILLLHILFFEKSRRLYLLVLTIPFFAISIGSFFLMTSIAAKATIITNNIEDWTLSGCMTKLATALQIVLFYIVKLLIPQGLSAAYDVRFAWSLMAPAVVAIAVGLALVIVVCLYYRKKYPCLLFAVSWYLLSLTPVLNLFATSPVVADRYAYLPSFAVFFLFACAVSHLSKKIKPMIPLSVIVLIVGYLGWETILRNRIWFSDETLWTATIKTSPNNFKGHRNLGNYYLEKGDFSKALSSLLPIADSDPVYYFARGLMAFRSEDMAAAKNCFLLSLGRDVTFVPSLFNLALVYERMGDIALATEMLQQTLKLPQPGHEQFKEKARQHLARISKAYNMTQ